MYRTRVNGVEVEVDSIEELRVLIDAVAADGADGIISDDNMKAVVLHAVSNDEPEPGGEWIAVRPIYLDVLEVLMTFQDEGITARGIAGLLDISAGTASSRLYHLKNRGLATPRGWTWFPGDRVLQGARIVAS